MSVEVQVARAADAELIEALGRLLPQMGGERKPPTAEHLREIVGSPATTLLVARDQGRIIGTLTLTIFRTPGELRGKIDDVVVDSAARGKGAGEALTREALRLAKERGVAGVELTSRPSREAANRLYRRLGFQLKQTNAYRFPLKQN